MEFYSEKTIFNKLESHYNVFNNITKHETDEIISYKYHFEGETGIMEISFNKITQNYEAKFFRKGKWEKIYSVSHSEICTVLDEFLR